MHVYRFEVRIDFITRSDRVNMLNDHGGDENKTGPQKKSTKYRKKSRETDISRVTHRERERETTQKKKQHVETN